jgi:hypothetical protein
MIASAQGRSTAALAGTFDADAKDTFDEEEQPVAEKQTGLLFIAFNPRKLNDSTHPLVQFVHLWDRRVGHDDIRSRDAFRCTRVLQSLNEWLILSAIVGATLSFVLQAPPHAPPWPRTLAPHRTRARARGGPPPWTIAAHYRSGRPPPLPPSVSSPPRRRQTMVDYSPDVAWQEEVRAPALARARAAVDPAPSESAFCIGVRCWLQARRRRPPPPPS